ncbi:MAG: transcriptional regulator, MarR family [Devosia sp.]|uniref:MarR family winged helix-turn-helix transcriptional regulator n=1 Tax=Devosia sp. TaxID=1871048 RepID=UPI00262D3A75|nr:MarR family transcriptional regulator [Devosia sp.]MDB5539517.1 transcriptional regulator, MarR family [Devosia sp.]
MKHEKNPEIPSAYELDELACTHTALRRAARRLGHLYDEAVAPTGLKATQVALLLQADRLGGVDGPTMNALAERLALSISSLTYALRPLVRDGLIRLAQDVHDKRTKHASLTALGRKRLAEGVKLWNTANRRTELVLGHDSATQLRALADGVSSTKFLDAYRAGRPAGSMQ